MVNNTTCDQNGNMKRKATDMPAHEPVDSGTVGPMARQLLGSPLTEADAAAAAGMLNALAVDMRAFRKLPLGDEEPATTYAAAEGEP